MSQTKFKQSNLFGELLNDSHIIEESMNKSSPKKGNSGYQNNILKLIQSSSKKNSKHRVVVYLTDEQHRMFRQKCFDLDMGHSNYIANLIIKDLLKS